MIVWAFIFYSAMMGMAGGDAMTFETKENCEKFRASTDEAQAQRAPDTLASDCFQVELKSILKQKTEGGGGGW